ncbi:type I restriction endonuclease subunit R [Salipaludibacillus agaradhaerens]|uniref:type I restriction endonuclease subunit R n=1 Tax=Salipaludibacillus agaradhaerens TaxID=76935 RepID=UPI0021507855|nr:type I restriction endonuclease [Salipaludibacillus agaradhaerens]MCR6106872.1 type I restriction endonuclease subunit R [Salipaludibacillus agaradhaerens]MCR6118904.1 type I restriction endonuclease subunit R [Salipaludibacillus agaradhaerens]
MVIKKNEKALEDVIEAYLLEDSGYTKGFPSNFDAELALDPPTVISFIKATQPKEWQKLESFHGADTESKVIQRLVQVLGRDGMLKVLRKGFDFYNVRIKMAYFKPASGLNPETAERYNKNILSVTRQVYYSTRNRNSLDMVLNLNGLPIATVELKNQFTTQTVEHAKKQYRQDRDPKETIFQFQKRALVHFAVDTDEVYMTTELKGKSTFFLPFNKGYNKGAGNPTDPEGGFRTSYLWREVWQKDSMLEIIQRFLHLQVEEKIVDDKKIVKEKMIFPRYHQLDVVRKLQEDVYQQGPGKNYLIQHSAGSGKSNSIAWITHRLSNLHNQQDQLVFDSVIVITDRRVLDKQLQDTIYQFEHAQGVVRKIDQDSRQLSEAIKSGAKIIISTIQKFTYIVEQVEEQAGKNFAIIIDEAHSSQTGESASALKEVLAAKSLEEAQALQEELDEARDETEERILKTLSKRGQQSNLSFFAFTATPKAKTLEMFGQKGSEGTPEPFHLYSMRQAIEEGFILDVLQNYMTYKTYFKLAKMVQEDPEMEKKKANRAIARFVSLHPHNLGQKTEVMIEHFRRVTMHKIQGRGKAMVVTSSRLHAYRYKIEFDRYIKRMGYTDLRTLVAFSGSIQEDDGEEYTEEKINSIKENELPEKFSSDDYQVLIVAEKYQTGFDQPLLHTMFVDKKLSGIQAVQTLSRLNRTQPGKLDTFVLDFVNEAEDIQKAFLPYFEQTMIEKETDLHLLYDLKSKLDDYQIYWDSEVDAFSKAFFIPSNKQRKEDLGKLHRYVDPAVDRYNEKPEDEQDEFKSSLTSYVRLYSFISQISPFQSVELHKLHAYGQLLLKKLPKQGDAGGLSLDNEVELEYYRLEETGKGSISLVQENQPKLKGITDAGAGSRPEDEEVALSTIIEVLNERFGTEFSGADKLFFDQIEEDMMEDEDIQQSAKNNTKDNFKYVFDEVFLNKAIERMGQNQEIFAKLMDDPSFQSTVKAWLLDSVYGKLHA